VSPVPLPASVAERTVRDLLDARAREVPERIALVAPSALEGAMGGASTGPGSGQAPGSELRLSYAELRERAGRMAAVLAARGVGKGDRVALLTTNDAAAEAHIAYHAAHRLGAINVPLNTRYVRRELAYVLRFVAPAAIVFEERFASLLGELREEIGDAALLALPAAGAGSPTARSAAEGSPTAAGSNAASPAAPGSPMADGDGRPAFGESLAASLAATAGDPEPPPAALDEGDDADWIFTSGTTGTPKAVALTHGGSVACGTQAIELWGLDATSVYQSFAPFFTSTGCHTNLLACLAAGCTYVVEPAFDVHGTLERMERRRTTSVFLISSVLQLIFDRVGPDALAHRDLGALRRICYGGQPASPAFYRQVWEQLGERLGVELTNVYGLTEGGTAGTMLTPEDHPEALARMGPLGLSIGRTSFHPWSELAVLDADGAPVAAGAVGELCLRGPSTMSRYVRDPEATAAAFHGDWVRTGDMVSADDAGFLSFVDREKQLIRRGGLNISSAEVEGVLAEHPAVVEAAAVPLPNRVLGEDVRGVVVLASGAPPSAQPPTEAELIAFCRERLADYKVPVRIDVVTALPRNGMGRVMKGVLTGRADALRAAE
jgi:acyl-CoA synthetase (AMP-forming)/AMP-acid ligase II